MNSNWVKNEIEAGKMMELKQKGFNEKFLIPVIITKCDLPILLQGKFHIEFSSKSFDQASKEVQAILDKPSGPQDSTYQNQYVKSHSFRTNEGKYGLFVEFGVHVSPFEPYMAVLLNAPYTKFEDYYGTSDLTPDNIPTIKEKPMIKYMTRSNKEKTLQEEDFVFLQ